MNSWNWETISENIHIDEVMAYPNLPWSKAGLSKNMTITTEVVVSLALPNATGEWNWDKLHKVIDLRGIKQYIGVQWKRIYQHQYSKVLFRSIGFEYDERHIIQYLSSDLLSSMFPRIVPISVVRKYYYLPWDKASLSCNPNLTIDDIESLYLPNSKGKWSYTSISKYMHISELMSRPDIIRYTCILNNKTLTIKDLLLFRIPTKGYHMGMIAKHMHISEIEKYSTWNWNKTDLSCNPSLTIRVMNILNNKDKPYKFHMKYIDLIIL